MKSAGSWCVSHRRLLFILAGVGLIAGAIVLRVGQASSAGGHGAGESTSTPDSLWDEASSTATTNGQREWRPERVSHSSNGEAQPAGLFTSSSVQPQGAGRAVNIGFDEVQWGTVVGSFYPDVRFSSPGLFIYTQSGVFGISRSSPNYIDRGVSAFSASSSADFFVDFPKPVDNLRFYITAIDAVPGSTFGKLDYYRNGTLVQQNLPIQSAGRLKEISILLTGITRVRVHSIFDPGGLGPGVGFDDFTFTVPPSTPTPTPTPIPTPTPVPTPQEPGNLKAKSEEEAIDLSWTASQGGTSYVLERSIESTATSVGNPLGIANGPDSLSPNVPAPAVLVPTTPICLPSGSCTFRDSDPSLSTEVEYSYVAIATGPGGQSRRSNVAKAKPLPKPGCYSDVPTVAPQSGHVSPHLGWELDYAISPDDGLVISNVRLNGRKMADSFSVPYYKIHIANTPGPERGELMPNGTRADGKLASRLIKIEVSRLSQELRIHAKYSIENIPGAKGCMSITQTYQFFAMGFEMPDEAHMTAHDSLLKGPCEPSGTISTCSKFRPAISYQFHPGQGDVLQSINIPQRFVFQVKNNEGNTLVLTRDKDGPSTVGGILHPFALEKLPLLTEEWFGVIKRRTANDPNKDAGSMDNFHQTNSLLFVKPQPNINIFRGPWVYPGCPECVHMHWRWSKAEEHNGPPFRPSPLPSAKGHPLVPPDSDQTLDIAVVVGRSSENEIDPQDYASLVNGEPLASDQPDARFRRAGALWYSSHGFANQDTFFWNPSWFNFQDTQAPGSARAFNLSAGVAAPSDGPIAVEFGDFFRIGTTTLESVSLNELPSLPPGYEAVGNTAHSVATDGVVSGPHTIYFAANSVANETAFNNLRIFHIDVDPFDPERLIWVDNTVLAPESPSPDFAARTLAARSYSLGVFVIGRLVQSIPADTSVADLSVQGSHSADPITADNTLTYTFTIRNNGPQVATDVAFMNALSPDVHLVSFQSSQGTTKLLESKIYGKIGTLVPGASTTFTLVVIPTEGFGTLPATGKTIFNYLAVGGKQTDSNPENNQVRESTKVLPNPDQPPTVSITAPTAGAIVQAPAQIMISGVANDSDGTVSKLELFENGNVVSELLASTGQFSISRPNLGPGTYKYRVVAEDNLGRMGVSQPVVVTVNGPASIQLTSPGENSRFIPGSTINLAAQTSHPSGTISHVEFFANGRSLGHVMQSHGGVFKFLWEGVESNVYSLWAVATDNLGIESHSLPVTITVNEAPTIGIISPLEGQSFASNSNIGLAVGAADGDGQIAKVDFFANGSLIGSATDIDTDKFFFTWRNVPDGQYTLTAVATDNLGLDRTSDPINIGVNSQPARPGEFVWFDDALPPGAVKRVDGDVDWYWTEANPEAFSGTKAHQSRNYKRVAAPANTIHSHSFDSATTKMRILMSGYSAMSSSISTTCRAKSCWNGRTPVVGSTALIGAPTQ